MQVYGGGLGAGHPSDSMSSPLTFSSVLQKPGPPDFPCAFYSPPVAQPQPQPTLTPITLAPPRPLLVPKAERLSPPAPGKRG